MKVKEEKEIGESIKSTKARICFQQNNKKNDGGASCARSLRSRDNVSVRKVCSLRVLSDSHLIYTARLHEMHRSLILKRH